MNSPLANLALSALGLPRGSAAQGPDRIDLDALALPSGRTRMASTKRTAAVVFVLGLLQASPEARSEPPGPWRRIEALEHVVVLTCAGDPSLFRVVRSPLEEQKLLTPKFHETCSSGTLRQRIWPCCGEGGLQLISSRAALERALAGQAKEPRAPGSPAPRWMEAYLAEVDRAIPSFEKETLVFLSVPYGGSGMAKADLGFSERDGVLTAEVRVSLPPPPLTPDTAVFHFAFAFDKARIREVKLVTVPPAPSAKH